MMQRTIFWSMQSVAAIALVSSALVAGTPVLAQDSATTLRVDKLEKEMKAVQRKVFGVGGVVEPDLSPTTPVQTDSGSAAPITDLTARVDALEAQLAKLTGSVEQNSFKLRQLENRIAALSAPAATSGTPTSEPLPTSSTSTTTPATNAQPKPAVTAKPAPPVAAKPSDARLAKVKAVEIPSTGNAAEDAYTYGYRLWDAKLYPEAQVQLQKVVKTYPTYGRMSFARNLLGRAYMDDGQNENAVHAFYDNYKTQPNGERAADSLMYLGMTFAKMKNKQASCTSFTELFKNYGDTMNAGLKAQATAERTKAGCPA